MSQETATVLLIPGLHPRGGASLQRHAYNSAVPLWRKDGFNVIVQQFGWNDRMSLADRQHALLEVVDALPGEICGIGASAGSLALVGAWRERPEKFRRLITVASPLVLTEDDFAGFKHNPVVSIPKLLREVYMQADAFLNLVSADELAKIISVHGRHDPRVLPKWSQRSGIESVELPVNGHGKTIAAALRKYRHKLQVFLAT